jgi:hypothetical protein
MCHRTYMSYTHKNFIYATQWHPMNEYKIWWHTENFSLSLPPTLATRVLSHIIWVLWISYSHRCCSPYRMDLTWWAHITVAMKTDGNGRKNPSPVSAPTIHRRKRVRDRNNHGRKWVRVIWVYGNEPIRPKMYRKRTEIASTEKLAGNKHSRGVVDVV